MEISNHSSQFTIRHGECDALQHLYTGSYFRLMQEATVETLIENNRKLRENEGVWVPAAAYLDMQQPIHMGEHIAVSVEPKAASRGRMSFNHVFQRAEGGSTLSRGSVDWQLQNPEESIAAHIPCREQSDECSVPAPPALTTQPEGAIRHRVLIGWSDISQEHMVHNSRYMDTMVNAAMQAGNIYGWTWERLHEEGFVFVAKKQWLLYHASARLSDEVEVTTWLGSARRSSALRQYLLHRVSNGLLLAEGHTLFVTIDTGTGRPVRIPQHFRRDLAEHISPDARV